MNKNINILMLFLCSCLVIIVITGSYKYNSNDVAVSIEDYQKNNRIYHDAYKNQINVSIISNKIATTNNIDASMKKVKELDYEGIYYVEFETYFTYIKFLDDSSVITTSTNMPPEKAVKLINKDLQGVPKGKYTKAGKNIKFTTLQEKSEGKVVKVEYKGQKKNGKLYLSSYSQSTKNNRLLIYKYYKKNK